MSNQRPRNFFTALVLTAFSLLLAASCALTRGSVEANRPDLLPQYDSMVVEEKGLKAELESARDALEAAAATEDPADDEEAAAAVDRIAGSMESLEGRFAVLEEAVNRRQAEMVGGPLNTLVPGAGTLLLAAVPLLGRRGRKHYANALRSATKGQLLTAVGDVLRAMGARHSSPESASAAESGSGSAPAGASNPS